MPARTERKAVPQPQSHSHYSEPVYASYAPEPDVISIESAQELANEAAKSAANETARLAADKVVTAANEAAVRAVAAFKQSTDADTDTLNLDREVKRAFFEKIRKKSFGDMLSEQIDNEMASQLASRLIPGLFGSSNSVKEAPVSKGPIAFILDVLNTQFAYGAGQAVGTNATELIKAIGQERVGQFLDAYRQKMTGGEDGQGQGQGQGQLPQRQLSPEEHMKNTENVIMGLDSTDDHDVTTFMQATGIPDYAQAQTAILMEQDRILQNRGLAKQQPVQPQRPPAAAPPGPPAAPRSRKQRPDDINRQLIDQYQNGYQDDSIDSAGMPPGGGFFEDTVGSGSPFDSDGTGSMGGMGNMAGMAGTAMSSENEFILSLNPDDPVSQQQFMAKRGIKGVPVDIVKTLMVKERKKLMESPQNESMNPVQDENAALDQPNVQNISPKSSTGTTPDLAQVFDFDSGQDRVLYKKEDFLKEIGVKPDVGSSNDTKSITESSAKSSNEESAKTDQDNNINTTGSGSDNISNIMNILQKIGDNFDASLKNLNQKIGFLEDEIACLKSKEGDQYTGADTGTDAEYTDTDTSTEYEKDVDVDADTSTSLISNEPPQAIQEPNIQIRTSTGVNVPDMSGIQLELPDKSKISLLDMFGIGIPNMVVKFDNMNINTNIPNTIATQQKQENIIEAEVADIKEEPETEPEEINQIQTEEQKQEPFLEPKEPATNSTNGDVTESVNLTGNDISTKQTGGNDTPNGRTDMIDEKVIENATPKVSSVNQVENTKSVDNLTPENNVSNIESTMSEDDVSNIVLNALEDVTEVKTENVTEVKTKTETDADTDTENIPEIKTVRGKDVDKISSLIINRRQQKQIDGDNDFLDEYEDDDEENIDEDDEDVTDIKIQTTDIVANTPQATDIVTNMIKTDIKSTTESTELGKISSSDNKTNNKTEMIESGKDEPRPSIFNRKIRRVTRKPRF